MAEVLSQKSGEVQQLFKELRKIQKWNKAFKFDSPIFHKPFTTIKFEVKREHSLLTDRNYKKHKDKKNFVIRVMYDTDNELLELNNYKPMIVEIMFNNHNDDSSISCTDWRYDSEQRFDHVVRNFCGFDEIISSGRYKVTSKSVYYLMYNE